MKLVSYDEYLQMKNSSKDPVLVDTRMPMFARAGRLEHSITITIQNVVREGEFGAHLAPDPKVAAQTFAQMGIDSSRPIVLTGDYTDPTMLRIAWTLEYVGHKDVYCISDSIALLQKNGVTVSQNKSELVPAKFQANPVESMLIGADEIKSSNDIFLIDARTLPEYSAGHLPSASLMPHTVGLGKGGVHFMDEENLAELFAKVPKDKDLVCYCMHGTRASSLFYQLKLGGFENVRLYDGSFVQWRGLGLALE